MENNSPTRPSDPGRSAMRPQSGGRKLTREERMQAIRRRQRLQDAAAICDADISQYSLIYEAVLKTQVDSLIRLEEIVSRADTYIKEKQYTVV